MQTTPQQWAAADRLIAIVLMRHAGLSFPLIGRELGISDGTAYSLYKKAISHRSGSRVARYRWFERAMIFNERLRTREPDCDTAGCD